jgi:hypothetical protein
MQNRLKETRGDLFADRTSTVTIRANHLPVWFTSLACAHMCDERTVLNAIVKDATPWNAQAA